MTELHQTLINGEWVGADASFPTFRSSNRRSRHQNVGNGLLDRDVPAQLGDVPGGLDVVLGDLDIALLVDQER